MFIHTYDEYWNQGHSVASFSCTTAQRADIREWCHTVYGPQGDRWKDCITFGEVVFSERKDLVLFLLRWQ